LDEIKRELVNATKIIFPGEEILCKCQNGFEIVWKILLKNA